MYIRQSDIDDAIALVSDPDATLDDVLFSCTAECLRAAASQCDACMDWETAAVLRTLADEAEQDSEERAEEAYERRISDYYRR